MTIKDLLKDAYKDGMTLEDIEKALAGITLPSANTEDIEKLKNALSKSNSEAADYKKQLRERQTADEAAAAEAKERQEKLQKDYDALLAKVSKSEHKAKFLAIGYDEDLAEKTAEAMVKGDTDSVFAAQKSFMEAQEKKLRAEFLNGTPHPDKVDSSDKTITKEQFDKMDYNDRVALYQNDRTTYDRLSKET